VAVDDYDRQGAGDQGIMFGYASNETNVFMPAPVWLAHRLSEKLTKVRKNGTLVNLRPDGKTQVTLGYDSNNTPVSVDTIVVSTQHTADYDLADLAADVRAATPSNAAQLLFPDKHEVRRQLALRLGSTSEVIQQQIKERRLNATMLQQVALEQWSHRVDIAKNAILSQQRIIAEYDPEMVLRRGYAMISGDRQIGSIVKITTKDMIMKARVESSEKR